MVVLSFGRLRFYQAVRSKQEGDDTSGPGQ